jgi:hypothetical protein
MKTNGLLIAVDFDGTCVKHEYPKVGADIGAVPVLKELVKAGHKLILNTVRSEKYLEDAVEWFNKNDIPLFGINDNPIQREWSRSPKIYANIYIDDAALGCPLRYHPDGQRPWVDWLSIKDYFKYAGII